MFFYTVFCSTFSLLLLCLSLPPSRKLSGKSSSEPMTYNVSSLNQTQLAEAKTIAGWFYCIGVVVGVFLFNYCVVCRSCRGSFRDYRGRAKHGRSFREGTFSFTLNWKIVQNETIKNNLLLAAKVFNSLATGYYT